MTKDEFVKEFAEYFNSTKWESFNQNGKLHGNKKPISFNEAKDMIDLLCEFMTYKISVGEKIQFPGYFTFGTKIHKGRWYRDPRNDNPVKKDDWVKPYCKFGSKIIDLIKETLTVEHGDE